MTFYYSVTLRTPYAIAAVSSNAKGSSEWERLNKWAGEMPRLYKLLYRSPTGSVKS